MVAFPCLRAEKGDGPCTHHPCHSFRAVQRCGEAKREGSTCRDLTSCVVTGHERAETHVQYAESMQVRAENVSRDHSVPSAFQGGGSQAEPASDTVWACHSAGHRLSLRWDPQHVLPIVPFASKRPLHVGDGVEQHGWHLDRREKSSWSVCRKRNVCPSTISRKWNCAHHLERCESLKAPQRSGYWV